MIEKLTIQEEEAIRIIWSTGEGCIKDFLEAHPTPKPPYTTFASIVKNLERKQYIVSKQVGNTYYYHPVVSKQEYKRLFMSGFVKNYFENSYQNLVAFFVKDQTITKEQLKELMDMIDKKQG